MAERSNVGSSKRVVRISHTELVNIANQLKSEQKSDNSKLDVKVTGRLNRGEAMDEKSSSSLSSHSRRMSSPAAQTSRKLSGVQKPSVDSGCRSERAMSERPSSRPPSSLADRDEERKLGRARRPDIQIYIPKPKMAMLRENLVPKEAVPESSSEKLHASSSGTHRPKPRQRALSEQSGSQEVSVRQEERLNVGDSDRGADSTPTQTRTSPRSKRNQDKSKKREREKRSSISTKTFKDKDYDDLPRGGICESSVSGSYGGTIELATSPPKESIDSIPSRVPNLLTERVADASKPPVVCSITCDSFSAPTFQSLVPSGDVRLNSNRLSAGSGSSEMWLPSAPPKGRGRLGRQRCETMVVGQRMAASDSTTSTSGIMAGIQKLRIDLEPEFDGRLVSYATSTPEPVQEVTTAAAVSVDVPQEAACTSAAVGDVEECSKDDEVEPKAEVDEACDEPSVVQSPPRRILDWSAEVEASEENEELSENWSPVWPSQLVDDEMSKEELAKSPSKPRKVKKKRKDSRSVTKPLVKEAIVERSKNSSKPKKMKRRPDKDFGVKMDSPQSDRDARTPESATKSGGGIIHLPPSVESTLAVENSCVPLAERDYGKKQLYDPDHPERPLCVVTPASHVSPYEHYHSGQSPPPAVQRTTFPYPGPGVAMGRPSLIPPQFVTPQNFYTGYATGFPQVPLPPRGPLYFPMTPGLHPGIPADFSASSSNVMYKLSATEKNVREAMILETELNMMLNQPFGATDPKKLGQCRWKIQLRYENTILSDMEFCMKHNVEQTLWRAAFYQVIESYRRQMVEDPTRKEEIRTALISLIDEGIVFYENLLEKMQETYGFNLNDFLDSNALRPQTLSRTLKSTLMSAQKVTICLGDLARYREYACDSSNYGKARSWYLKAQQLAPKNGRPYNQLAILAVYARRKLDAVYYYMRSLAASNAFQTAKEGLISIFDDARKKYEQQEKSREEARRSSKNSLKNSKSGGKRRQRGSRQQTVIIWYTPEGAVANQDLVEDDDDESNRIDEDDDDLSSLQPVELNKRFSLSFLHIHGKLYSRVGMETFAEAFVRMLREFRLLLRTRPPTMMANRLLQIITINMYAIYKAGHEATDAVPVESHCQTVIQGRALEVGVEMFRQLVERCCELLEPAPPTAETFSDDLEQLLPAVKIWCDWFMCHPAVWNPLPSLTDLGDASDKRDVWTELAHLLNLLKDVDTGLLLEDAQDGCELLVLPEDVALAGFIPLLSLSEKAIYVLPPVNKDLARNLLRVYRIVFCTSGFLCGLPSPVLAFDVDSRQYVAVSNDLVDEPVKIQTRLSESDPSEEPVEKIEESTEDWDNCWPDDPTCHHLRTRKQQLEKVKAHQEMQQQQIQAVLQEASQAGNIRFEVYPQWLVPDTNCFIDHLAHIRVLARHGKFHLAVPLVVINELDGLAQGQRAGEIVADPTAQAHAYMVSRNAQDALQFLTDCFQSHNPLVRAVTAKGSLLSTIAFRSEETYDKLGTNDDIILACCIKLCEEQSFGRTKFQKFKRKDGVELICRNVVLLTDDRNLRVKAHAYDMAVEAVPRFAELMNVHG